MRNLLQLLVAVVDAELLEAVHFENLEAVDVQHSNHHLPRATTRQEEGVREAHWWTEVRGVIRRGCL